MSICKCFFYILFYSLLQPITLYVYLTSCDTHLQQKNTQTFQYSKISQPLLELITGLMVTFDKMKLGK